MCFKSRTLLILSLLLFVQQSFCQSSTKSQIIEKVWKACGGKEKFEQSQYFEFTFAVAREGKILSSRTHLWDRYSGNYRFEYSLNKDSMLTVLFNVNSQKGKSYINKKEVTNDSLNLGNVKDAYETFINDTYWLMVPLKLEDPGVRLQVQNDTVFNQKEVDVLHLDFDSGIGITDKDEYWLYVDKNSGAILGWKYDLEGRKGKPRTYNWSEYVDLGNGLKLPKDKTTNDGKVKIYFPEAKVLNAVDSKRFIKP